MLANPFDTEQRRAFREQLRDFMHREVDPHKFDWDEAGDVPWELHQKFGALGLWGFGIDERYGGHGFDDAFMRWDASVEIARCGVGGVGAAIGGRGISLDPIQRLALPEIRERVLPEIISGRKGSSLAITEPGGGSDVARLKTTARRDGNHWVINGSKTFITGGMRSDYFVVGARTGGDGLGGISLFFVEADTPGFSRTPLARKQGWWASDQATLYFDDCRVPASHLMGEENRGFLAIMQNFNYERLALVGQALGMMEACLEDSIAWARERETFGRKLVEHQVIRHKIAEMSSRVDAVRALGWSLCATIESGTMPVAEITKAKFFATQQLEYVAREAMQILGGAGYLRGNRVETIYREVRVVAIGGGSEEIMRDLAARQMGI